MTTSTLTRVPTLLVLAAAGLAAWPLLTPEGGSPGLGGGTRPPEAEKRPAPDVAASTRNPFRADWMARPTPPPKPTLAGSKAEVLKVATGSAPRPADPKAAGAPGGPPAADPALDGLKLGGTLVVGREQLAVIGGKVYARGERLRARDGSPLPYVVSEVRKDRAVLARGDRRVVLGFADPAPAPAAGPRAPDPAPAPTPAPTGPIAATAPAPARGPLVDPIRRALGMAAGPGVDAGIDALLGRLDGIGRAGDGGSRP